jgi:nicotinate phosphoribosyltransferase
MSLALRTDLYELRMAASYLSRAMTAEATFSLYVRDLPPQRGFLVSAGLESCLEVLEQFHFDTGDLAVLEELGFDENQTTALGRLRFTGDVRAVPEGRIVFAGEPLIEVRAPIAEAQIVETHLLNQLTFQTALASKAARCRVAARDRIELVEFGLRRTAGDDGGLAAARAAGIVGFAGTSNVAAAARYGLPASGTMAHSYVEAFGSERAAFDAFATVLVDTYDTRGGVAAAIDVIGARRLERAAVRLDSGDLAALARVTRDTLDAAGLRWVRIFVSGDVDEYALEALLQADAPIDAAGVGTRLGVSADAPWLNTVYKLVEYAGRPTVKLSAGKATLPGAKQVFRGPGLHDVLALAIESAPAGTEPLLEPVMRNGRRLRARVDEAETVATARVRFEADLRGLPPGARRVRDPDAPTPVLSDALTQLRADAVRAVGMP